MKKYTSILLIIFAVLVAVDVYYDNSIQPKPYVILGIIFIRGIYGLFADTKKDDDKKKWVAIFIVIAALILLGKEAIMCFMSKDYSQQEIYYILLAVILAKGLYDLINCLRDKQNTNS